MPITTDSIETLSHQSGFGTELESQPSEKLNKNKDKSIKEIMMHHHYRQLYLALLSPQTECHVSQVALL